MSRYTFPGINQATTLVRRSLPCGAIAMLALAALPAAGQTAHYGGFETVVHSSVDYPVSVAVDKKGVVYILYNRLTNPDGGPIKISKATPVTSGSDSYTNVPITITPNHVDVFTEGKIVVDVAGNILVSYGTVHAPFGHISELKPGASPNEYALSEVFSDDQVDYQDGWWSFAVDQFENLYIAHNLTGHNLAEISLTHPTDPIRYIGPAWNQPTGVAVDGNGNISMTGFKTVAMQEDGISVVQEIEKGCEAVTCEPLLGSGWVYTGEIAVDTNENVYVIDRAVGGGTPHYGGDLYEVPWESFTGSYGTRTRIGYGFNAVNGVAVDGNGIVYVADSFNKRVVKLDQGPVNFGTWTVGTTSTTKSMTFQFDTAGKLGPVLLPTLLSTTPSGLLGMDFNDTGTGSCKAGMTYAADSTCTVVATCTPHDAVTYLGGAELTNSGGLPIASATLICTGAATPVKNNTPLNNYQCTTYDHCGDIVSYSPATIAMYNQPEGIVGPKNVNINGCPLGSAHPPDHQLCTSDGPIVKTPIKKKREDREAGLGVKSVGVSEITGTSARVSWKTTEAAHSGVLYETGKEPMGLTPKQAVATAAPTFLLDHLTPDTVYQVTVWSYTEDGKEFQSSVTLRTQPR